MIAEKNYSLGYCESGSTELHLATKIDRRSPPTAAGHRAPSYIQQESRNDPVPSTTHLLSRSEAFLFHDKSNITKPHTVGARTHIWGSSGQEEQHQSHCEESNQENPSNPTSWAQHSVWGSPSFPSCLSSSSKLCTQMGHLKPITYEVTYNLGLPFLNHSQPKRSTTAAFCPDLTENHTPAGTRTRLGCVHFGRLHVQRAGIRAVVPMPMYELSCLRNSSTQAGMNPLSFHDASAALSCEFCSSQPKREVFTLTEVRMGSRMWHQQPEMFT